MSPHSDRQHEKQRQAMVRTIVRAARRLFLKKGYHGTTIRDICRASGLSNGTLYFYFKNKDALYAHVYEECFQHLNAMVEQAVQPDMEPLAQIETVLKTYLRYSVEHHEMWAMLDVSYRIANLPPTLIERFDARLRKAWSFVHNAVQLHLERCGLASRFDTRELTLLLFTGIDGLLYDLKHSFFEDPIRQLTLERLVDTQIAVFKAYLNASAPKR